MENKPDAVRKERYNISNLAWLELSKKLTAIFFVSKLLEDLVSWLL